MVNPPILMKLGYVVGGPKILDTYFFCAAIARLRVKKVSQSFKKRCMGKIFNLRKFRFFWTQYCSTRENKNFDTHIAYVAAPELPFIANIKKMG